MQLAIDRRAENIPGTHALIVGISHYDAFGPGGPGVMGLPQLTTAARSAYRFYDWLTQSAALPVPLVTCRLMLAPSPEEMTEPGIENHVQGCKVNDFLVAANEWIMDACRSDHESTIFYFVGHKLRFSSEDDTLLFQDFGATLGPKLRGGVNFANILNGMGSQEVLTRQTQHYFLDGSRTNAESAVSRGTTDVFDVSFNFMDRRNIGVFYASAPGDHAFSHAGGITFFTESLLQGLNSAAASKPDPGSEWAVTTRSLARWMGRAVEKYAEHDIVLNFPVNLRGDDSVICNVLEVPHVRVNLRLRSPEPVPGARVRISSGTGEQVAEVALDSSRAELHLPAGFYALELQVGGKSARTLIAAHPPSVEFQLTLP